MIYWLLQEATTVGGQGGSTSWLLSAGVIGATVSLIGLILAQLRHTQTLRQTRELEDKRRLEARELEAQRAGEAALQKYFEQVGKLLSEKPLREAAPDDNLRTVVRAQTLAVLEGLDPDRKRILLQFLYEQDLLLYEQDVLSSPNPVVNLYGANLSGLDLSGIKMNFVNLSGTDLTSANLSRSWLTTPNLSNADLTEADFTRAWLSGADLIGARLTKAKLVEAKLIGAKLGDDNESFDTPIYDPADLTEADFREAWLSGADLSQAVMLTQEQINQANGDETTKLPDHLQLPAHWSKGESKES